MAKKNLEELPLPIYLLEHAVQAVAPLLIRAGRVESRVHRGRMRPLDRPVYITGVPRAGTTISIEMLSKHPDVATHVYYDFVQPYLPIWWGGLMKVAPVFGQDKRVERIHRDGLESNHESPEGVEEMIWVRWFDHLHDENRPAVLNGETSNPGFERYYPDYLARVVAAKDKTRYAAKNNYVSTRLPYLLRVVPDARVLLYVRHPLNHVASLCKQDRLFHTIAKEMPRQFQSTVFAGHTDFGPVRQAVHLGDEEHIQKVKGAFGRGDLATGWALHWAGVYEMVLNQIEKEPALAAHCRVIRYEDLCAKPETTIRALLEHAGLDAAVYETVIAEYAARLNPPTYYRPDFSEAEHDSIREITGPVAERFGYSFD